jgi:hypothetical protein
MLYDPDRDLYLVLGVRAGAIPTEIRSAIVRQWATVAVQDLAEASRLLLSPTRRVRYDLQRTIHRAGILARRLWRKIRGRRSAQARPGKGWWRSGARRA